MRTNSQSFFQNEISRNIPYPLIVPGWLLYGEGVRGGMDMTFRLTLFENQSVVSFATLNVHVNEAPYGGSMQISPLEGIAIETMFAIECYGWIVSEDALPLTYDIGYQLLNNEEGGYPMMLQIKSESNSIPYSESISSRIVLEELYGDDSEQSL